MLGETPRKKKVREMGFWTREVDTIERDISARKEKVEKDIENAKELIEKRTIELHRLDNLISNSNKKNKEQFQENKMVDKEKLKASKKAEKIIKKRLNKKKLKDNWSKNRKCKKCGCLLSNDWNWDICSSCKHKKLRAFKSPYGDV